MTPPMDLQAEIDKLRGFIESRGYRRCDVPACNCGSYHGGHATQRLGEIIDALEDGGVDMNGKTILSAVKALLSTSPAPEATPKAERKPFQMNVSREWIERMAKAEEECGDVSVGGGGVALSALAVPVSGETALREQINRIVGEMRSERSRYKSHDLGFVDSVSSSRVDEWADELEALLAPAQK